MTEPMPMPPPEKAHEIVAKPAKSKGEKLFDKITYVGIAGIGTLVVTVPVAYALEHHWWLKPRFDKAVATTEKLLSKLHINDAHETASKAVSITSLMQGGNLTLLPVALMEHFKIPIVRGFNAAMQDPTPEEQIERAPRQTLSSLVQSRLLSWGIVFASLQGVSKLFPGALKSFKHEFGMHAVKFTNRFRAPANRILEAAAEGTRSYGYGVIAALDIFATAAATTLLYLVGHFLARKQEDRKERKLEHQGMAAPMRDDGAEEAVLSTSAAPNPQVAGGKQHDGMAAAAPAVAQQV